MDIKPLSELAKRRKKLAKLLQGRITLDEVWPADVDAMCKEAIQKNIADIDAEIAERFGRAGNPQQAG